MIMGLPVPFIALLLLSLVREDSSYSCEKDENLSETQRELLVLIDEMAAAVNAVLDSPEYKNKAQAVTQLLQDMVCAGKISPSVAAPMAPICQHMIYNIQQGDFTKEDIMEFLDDYGLQDIESLLEARE
ncbi:hypothetical protein XENTR_v10017937 [Xenopus tropicalis]|nr:hypothetical protein XENTR_v10017937 [Xenopus tropicalis]